MRDLWRGIDEFLSRYLTPAVKWIFLINVGLFLLYVILGSLSNVCGFFFFSLMQTPYLLIRKLCLWQLVTYMFMHAGLGHLVFNMLVFWFFAPRLEYRWGTARFLRFYLIVGVGAGLFHPALTLVADQTRMIMKLLFAAHPSIWETYGMYLQGQSVLTLLGASGAIYGILVAYALYYPDDIVLLYFVVPIKIKYLVLLAGLGVLFTSLQGPFTGNVSHVTHLGGIVVALLYLKGGDWLRPGRKPQKRKKVQILEVNPDKHPDFY
jgi:membrane associated rhomboid family serine protease